MANPPPNGSGGRNRPKTSQAEKARRVHIIYEMMCDGLHRRQIQDAVKENFSGGIAKTGGAKENWNTTSRTIDRYIHIATTAFKAELLEDRRHLSEEIFAKYRRLYYRSVSSKQYGVALGCLRGMAALGGLEKLSLELKGDLDVHHDLSKLSDDELRQLSELKRKAIVAAAANARKTDATALGSITDTST